MISAKSKGDFYERRLELMVIDILRSREPYRNKIKYEGLNIDPGPV